MNCAAIPSELIESELFGHMKGSFTGAFADRAGKFEQADGGTLFLDEVGDMSLSAQAKLLRVLQEGVVTRIGGSKSIQVDVRVLAATNKDLEARDRRGALPRGLLYRLNVVPIEVPPLRERLEDIPALVAHFAEQLAAGRRRAAARSSPRTRCGGCSAALAGQHARAAQRGRAALILASGKVVTAADVDRLLPAGDGGCAPAARGRADLRGVQAGGGEELPGPEAPGARLERLGDGAGAQDAALEPVQEDRAVRPDPGAA